MKLIHLLQIILLTLSLSLSNAFGADFIYVTDQGDNTIKKIDQDGNATVFASANISQPAGLAFDRGGNLFLVNQGNNTIYKFDSNGNGTLFASAGLNQPICLTFDSFGNLYVANTGDSTVLKFDPNGNGTLFASNSLATPVGIACDVSNNIYVANLYLGSIIKFDTNGSGSVFANLGLEAQPYGICFDHGGNLFAAGSGNSTILKINPSGNVSVFATSTNSFLNNPTGFAFDEAGNLYEANYWYANVGKFDPSGQGVSFSSSNLGHPIFLAIYEPTLPPNIISWWAAEGNGNDKVGTNNAIVPSGVSYTNGEVGQAFYLDGSPNRILVPDAPELNFGSNQDFSIEAWVQPNIASTSFGVMSIVDKRIASGGGDSPNGYEFSLGNGQVECRFGSVSFVSAGPDLRDGLFHHVAMTVSRNSTNGGNLYADGVNVMTFDPTALNGSLVNDQPLRIGNHSAQDLDCFFRGIIDEASIYNRALASNEIAAIYNAGSAGKGNPYIPPPRPATGTAQFAGAFVVGVTITDGGAGYTNTPSVRFIGGGGTNAQASVVVSNGVVVAINIVSPGSGYTSTPVVVIDPPFISSPVLGITSISMLNFTNLLAGTNYQLQQFNSVTWVNQSTTFKATTNFYTTLVSGSVGSGDYRLAQIPVPLQATAFSQVVNGFVVGGTVNNQGSGYVTPPNVAIIANRGSNAVATASVNGGNVTAINIVSPGSGYVNPVTIQIDPPPATALSPAVALGVALKSSSLAPYDNYQIQFKPDVLSAWGNLSDGLFAPLNPTFTQNIFLTNNAGFFRLQFVP